MKRGTLHLESLPREDEDGMVSHIVTIYALNYELAKYLILGILDIHTICLQKSLVSFL